MWTRMSESLEKNLKCIESHRQAYISREINAIPDYELSKIYKYSLSISQSSSFLNKKLLYLKHHKIFNAIYLQKNPLSKSYVNDRTPERLTAFDFSKTQISKRYNTNAAKNIIEKWQFDWLFSQSTLSGISYADHSKFNFLPISVARGFFPQWSHFPHCWLIVELIILAISHWNPGFFLLKHKGYCDKSLGLFFSELILFANISAMQLNLSKK